MIAPYRIQYFGVKSEHLTTLTFLRERITKAIVHITEIPKPAINTAILMFEDAVVTLSSNGVNPRTLAHPMTFANELMRPQERASPMPRLIVYYTASSYDTVKTGKLAMPTSKQEMMIFIFEVAIVEAKKYMNVIREDSEIVKNTSSRLLDHLHTMSDAMPLPIIPPKLYATPAQATKSTSSMPNGSMN